MKYYDENNNVLANYSADVIRPFTTKEKYRIDSKDVRVDNPNYDLNEVKQVKNKFSMGERKRLCPKYESFIEAYFEKENGDATKMTALLSEYETVRNNNPIT